MVFWHHLTCWCSLPLKSPTVDMVSSCPLRELSDLGGLLKAIWSNALVFQSQLSEAAEGRRLLQGTRELKHSHWQIYFPPSLHTDAVSILSTLPEFRFITIASVMSTCDKFHSE